MNTTNMIETLPAEIYNIIVQKLQLRQMISLIGVSHHIQKLTLMENNWYTISDTRKLLHKFINQVVDYKSVSYPHYKIESMINNKGPISLPVDECENESMINNKGPISLPVDECENEKFYDFYDYFHNYQYLHIGIYFSGSGEDIEEWQDNMVGVLNTCSSRITKYKTKHSLFFSFKRKKKEHR